MYFIVQFEKTNAMITVYFNTDILNFHSQWYLKEPLTWSTLIPSNLKEHLIKTYLSYIVHVNIVSNTSSTFVMQTKYR